MKTLMKIADAYVAQSDWTDFALVKLCLAGLGTLAGLSVPKKHKKAAGLVSLVVFAATYVPLMVRFFRVAEGCAENKTETGA